MAQRGFNPGIHIPNASEAHPNVILSLQQIILKLGRLSNPQFKGMTLIDLAEAGAGFVKNDADGLITGGNVIEVSDLPAHATEHELGGGDEVDHDSLSGFVADEHVAHTGVVLTAGTGLTGGGDISASRSFAVDGLLEDLDTLGAASADGEFIVATGAGVLAWESGDTARHSLGLGTTDTPTFAQLNISATAYSNYDSIIHPYALNLYGYDDSVFSRSGSVNYYRSRGGTVGGMTAVQDDDWLMRFRCYGRNGSSSWDQYGGWIYKVTDASAVEGLLSLYYYDADAYYVAEFGKPHIRFGNLGTLSSPQDDYVQIDPTNGHMTFSGDATVWNDMQFEVSSGKLGAANNPTWATLTTNTSEYGFDVDDYIDLNSEEVSHGWKEGTAGNMHLHISIPDANSSGSSRYAQFTVYIAYVNSSGIWTETSLTAEQEIPDGSSALENFYLDLGDLTLTGLTIGTQIKCRIKRIAATGGTEYGSDVFIHQVGCHLEEDRIGSNTEASS